jgi:ubiquinone biosynthesis protein
LPSGFVAKLARFGTGAPRTPDFAAGLAAVGPAAIKLGQALATRPDLIGVEAASDLARLQDALPPVPFSAIEPQLNAACGGDWKTQFQSIEPEAVGAASIAQVHRGVTSDGRTVAIKLLRPGIEAMSHRRWPPMNGAPAIWKRWAVNSPGCARAP